MTTSIAFTRFFSGSFGSSRKDRPVYPYGSALEDEDYRDKFE